MSTLPPEILELRERAHHGGHIDQHRAFRRISNRTRISGSAVLMVGGLTAAVILLLPVFTHFWQLLLEFVTPSLGFTSDVAVQVRTVLPFVQVRVPYVNAVAPLPSMRLIITVAAITVVLFIASWLIPRKYLPFIYLLRLALIIQAISAVYFFLSGDRFPYTLASYSADMHTVGLAVIALVPVILGLTYFVFDFGVTRKLLIVALTIAHLLVFVPLQYVLHTALVTYMSLLFLPVLFMLFGLLLDVSVVIALYGWAMSWRDRSERMG